MKKILLILPGLLLVSLLFYLFNPLTVTVDGTGQVEAKPDSVTLAFAYSAQSEDVARAQAAVASKVKVVDGMMKTFSVEEKDIVRSQVNITPTTASNGKIVYTAVISVGVKMKNYEKVGDLVSSLYSNGASYVSQPVLSVEDNVRLERLALEDALSKAKTEVSNIANQNYRFFLKRVAIAEKSSATTSSFTGGLEAATASQGQGFKVTKTISVTYRMW